MFPPFDPEIAHHYCLKAAELLKSGVFTLRQITRISEERKNQGVMLGSLVCTDTFGRRVILITNSGISKQIEISKNNSRNSEIFFSDGKTFFTDGVQFIFIEPVVKAEIIDEALKKNDAQIHSLTDSINTLKGDSSPENIKKSEELKNLRKSLCAESLNAVQRLYRYNTLNPISACPDYYNLNKEGFVPTGTGDCCEPKLLHYAFGNSLKPISMDQIFFAPSSDCSSIPPCNERCGIILPKILGLEIIYADKFIVVVNKPSGLLSVPGRGEDKKDCVVNRIKVLYPELCKISQLSVHRLDMETSGLLVLAFTKEAHKNLSAQFEEGSVHKEYCALLDGVLEKEGKGLLAPKHGEKSGEIRLKFRLDVENRPHQIYDELNGKEGITFWENEGIVWYKEPGPEGKKRKTTKVRFRPQTGRTHQLRLASADLHGFGLPIVGDTLYGKSIKNQRLMLHAEKITFRHPNNGRIMTFTCEAPF